MAPPSPAPTAALDSGTPFGALAPNLRPLAERGERKRFRKRQRLIEEGELGDTLYIILSGQVRVFGTGGRDDREITYGVYGAGEYIGELSLDGGPRSASVEAIEACDCVVVTRRTLLDHIAEHPEFALDLLTQVIRRARSATLSAKQLALNDVYGRLVLLLNSLASDRPDGARGIGHLTHREMANRLGCSREMVSRLMKDLEHGGYLRADDAGYRLLKPLPARW